MTMRGVGMENGLTTGNTQGLPVGYTRGPFSAATVAISFPLGFRASHSTLAQLPLQPCNLDPRSFRAPPRRSARAHINKGVCRREEVSLWGHSLIDPARTRPDPSYRSHSYSKSISISSTAATMASTGRGAAGSSANVEKARQAKVPNHFSMAGKVCRVHHYFIGHRCS